MTAFFYLVINRQQQIAAETPQIETAEAKMTPNSSSTFINLDSRIENHTAANLPLPPVKFPVFLRLISVNKNACAKNN